MLKFSRLGIIVLVLPVLIASSCKASDYLNSLKEAVSQIELSSYDKAAQATQDAFAANSSDPLGHAVMGVIYTHTRKYAEAEREFKEAARSNPGSWHLQYALWLVAIAQNNHKMDAENYLNAARKLAPSDGEFAAFDAYTQFVMQGKEPQIGRLAGDLPLAKETFGVSAFRNGHTDDAIAALNDMLHTPAPLGFAEFRAPLATFDPIHPIEMPRGKLTWKPPAVKNIPVLSGVITLKADTSKTEDVSIVTFSVDGDLVGMTNCSPYQFEWNTEQQSNGIHIVKIEARNTAGSSVSSKTLKVVLSNASPRKVVPLAGVAVDELNARLWTCIKLTEARKLGHYYLGKIFLKKGDRPSALAQFQYAIAYDPNLLDARARLSEARGSKFAYTEIHRGKPGLKRIALTFDDGPNERTEEMLQVLHKLQVHATFFVVGFRAEAQPELIKKMIAGGYEIENHTYTHPRLPSLMSLEQEESELAKGAAVVLAMTGKPSLYFRPPGGRSDKTTCAAAARLGLTGIFWTLGCSPFEGARYQQLTDYVVNNACDGAIILMHNGEPSETSALPKIVNTLRAKGYQFVTISELLSGPASRIVLQKPAHQ